MAAITKATFLTVVTAMLRMVGSGAPGVIGKSPSPIKPLWRAQQVA